MRREEYERTYGRRSHHMPPPMPPPQEDPRSRRSRTKMKCLISIGLILPALAAVIGVAAWAVSADVVMNSGNNNRGNKADNMQNFVSENDNRRDIFRANEESERFRIQTQSSTLPPTTTSSSTTTQSTTTTTTTSAPVTLSPQEETDVNAILSKLISASGAATGGSGPRFVVVAPLPDNTDIIQGGQNSPSAISRVDNSSPTKPHSRDDSWQVSGHGRPEPDLMPSASSQNVQRYQVTMGRSATQSNLTSRMGSATKSDSSSTRRMGSKPYMISASSNGGNAFNNPQIQVDLTGFEPFDTMMHDFQSSQNTHQNPQPSFQSQGSFSGKRGPPQGHFNSRNQHKPIPMQQFDPNDQHIFHHHVPDHNVHGLQGSPSHPQGLMAPPPPQVVGLKPIQQQLHHMDPLQSSESNRWGNVGFHGPPNGGYHHKPPEGISLSISSPANSGTHVAVKEPVNVIKSFFLPFLPKPRLNMNARVVFGVVLDKGMGIGGDKKKFH